MDLIQEYTQVLLLPHLQALALTKPQRAIVIDDVQRRLESLLYHWGDLAFRRTILTLGTEEASFWEPSAARLAVRSLVVVAIRNSLIEDLGASQPYTRMLESRKKQLRDEQIPAITSEAIRYFETASLDAPTFHPKRDVFGDLPHRFPNAWHALSLLGGSSENEIDCDLPIIDGASIETSDSKWMVQHYNVVASGIDPRLDAHLVDILRKIKLREVPLFFSPSFKFITRSPNKLLFVIDSVLRSGGTLMTLNYFLSPTYLARRNPLIRPAHDTSEIESQIANHHGLGERHRELLAALYADVCHWMARKARTWANISVRNSNLGPGGHLVLLVHGSLASRYLLIGCQRKHFGISCSLEWWNDDERLLRAQGCSTIARAHQMLGDPGAA